MNYNIAYTETIYEYIEKSVCYLRILPLCEQMGTHYTSIKANQ